MHAHLIGICGSGLRSLAEHLLDLGWHVSGSDLLPVGHQAQRLRARGVTLHAGHHANHLANADVVVHSPAIPESNPERAAAATRQRVCLSYPAMLGRLIIGRRGVAIAGTHGKSTTTAMLGWILRHAGLDPSVICGAELLNLAAGGWAGDGDAFVVEACEFRGSFLHLAPRCAAMLDIEPDHFDCYSDLDAAVAAYAAFAARLPRDGLLVCRADRPAVRRAAAAAVARVQTFGVQTPADWSARDVQPVPGRTSFRIERDGRLWTECVLRVPGRHNVGNALAAAALAAELGVSPDGVRRALAAFCGVRRRFEPLGAWRGVELVDDYAHHPTALSATLAAARLEYPGRRICCAFQPHQVSRTRRLLLEFAQSLRAADAALVLPVYSAREGASPETTAVSRRLVQAAQACGANARFVPSLDHLVASVETDARPGEVLLLVGAGDMERVRDDLARRVPRHHAS